MTDPALLAVLFVAAAIVGWLATIIVRGVAMSRGIVNAPNPINPDHVQAVAYLGGLGIAAGVYSALALGMAASAWFGMPLSWFGTPALAVGALLLLSVGLADDLVTFGAARKIVLQIASVGIAMALGGLKRDITGIGAVDVTLSAVWLLAITNGFNFIDVSDGLAGSVAAAAFALFAVALSPFPALAAAIAGGCIGFLVLNRPPASVYMGDAGSHFLGFLMGAFSLTAALPNGIWPAGPMVLLLCALPAFDLAFQTTVRMHRGVAWWTASSDSFALRMRRAGVSRLTVAGTAVAVTVILWGAAFAMPQLPATAQAGLIVVIAAFVSASTLWLLRQG